MRSALRTPCQAAFVAFSQNSLGCSPSPTVGKDPRGAGHGGLGWRCRYLLGDFHGSSEMTATGHPSLVLIGLEVEMAEPQVSGPKMHK